MRVFVGDPPVGGLGVCRWVAKRIGKKRCDLKLKKVGDMHIFFGKLKKVVFKNLKKLKKLDQKS